MKKWIIATVVIGLIALASLAWSEPPSRGPGKNQEQRPQGRLMEFPRLEMILHNPDIAKQLGVTPEQIDALRQMTYENRQKTIKIRADLELAQVELQYLMEQEKPDQEKIEKSIDEAGKVRTQLEKTRVLGALKAKEILGEETATKINNWMREHRIKQPGPAEGNDREPPRD